LSRIRLEDVKVGNSYIIDSSTDIKPENDNTEQEKAVIIEAEKQAQIILEKAQQEALRIIEDTQNKSQELFNQAQEEGQKAGYSAGYETGIQQIKTEFVNQIKSIDILASSVFDIKKEIIVSAEQEIVKLSIVIAEKLVRQQIDIDPEIIKNIVKAAINELKDKEEVKIVVNPAVTDYIYEFSEELKQTINGLEKIKVIEDKTIPPDGVIVESLESRIDARLDSQIVEITKRLMKEAAQNPVLKEIEIKIEEPKKRKSKDD